MKNIKKIKPTHSTSLSKENQINLFMVIARDSQSYITQKKKEDKTSTVLTFANAVFHSNRKGAKPTSSFVYIGY